MVKVETKQPPPNDLYEADFFAWTQEQAQLLRDGKLQELDIENLAEEIADVGRSNKREIHSRLEVLIAHLLKWKFQPGRQGTSWRNTIREQRRQIGLLISDSPSLKPFLAATILECYTAGALEAEKESGIDFSVFPDTCPFSPEEILDQDFFPLDYGVELYRRERTKGE